MIFGTIIIEYNTNEKKNSNDDDNHLNCTVKIIDSSLLNSRVAIIGV